MARIDTAASLYSNSPTINTAHSRIKAEPVAVTGFTPRTNLARETVDGHPHRTRCRATSGARTRTDKTRSRRHSPGGTPAQASRTRDTGPRHGNPHRQRGQARDTSGIVGNGRRALNPKARKSSTRDPGQGRPRQTTRRGSSRTCAPPTHLKPSARSRRHHPTQHPVVQTWTELVVNQRLGFPHRATPTTLLIHPDQIIVWEVWVTHQMQATGTVPRVRNINKTQVFEPCPHRRPVRNIHLTDLTHTRLDSRNTLRANCDPTHPVHARRHGNQRA